MLSHEIEQQIEIKPLSRENIDDVLHIAADTAFFGDPVEAFLEDRNLFLDFFYRYYTLCEMQSSWVAVADGKVVGFLTGCFNSRAKLLKWLRNIFPIILGNLIRNKYYIGTLTWQYLWALMVNQFKGGYKKAELVNFPAHFHINICQPWRGKGIGRKLIQTYLRQLSQEQIIGVHLYTTDQNISACRLYEKMGFVLLKSTPTRQWFHLLGRIVENRCYGLSLKIIPDLYFK